MIGTEQDLLINKEPNELGVEMIIEDAIGNQEKMDKLALILHDYITPNIEAQSLLRIIGSEFRGIVKQEVFVKDHFACSVELRDTDLVTLIKQVMSEAVSFEDALFLEASQLNPLLIESDKDFNAEGFYQVLAQFLKKGYKPSCFISTVSDQDWNKAFMDSLVAYKDIKLESMVEVKEAVKKILFNFRLDHSFTGIPNTYYFLVPDKEHSIPYTVRDFRVSPNKSLDGFYVTETLVIYKHNIPVFSGSIS